MKRKLICMTFASLLTAGCAGSLFHKAQKAEEPASTQFQQALHTEYMKEAESEGWPGDKENAAYYLQKAEAAKAGKPVKPYQVDEYGLPTETVPAFREAKTRLTRALTGRAVETKPYSAAEAQVAYDCWWENTVDAKGNPARARTCKDRFRRAIVIVEEVAPGEPGN